MQSIRLTEQEPDSPAHTLLCAVSRLGASEAAAVKNSPFGRAGALLLVLPACLPATPSHTHQPRLPEIRGEKGSLEFSARGVGRQLWATGIGRHLGQINWAKETGKDSNSLVCFDGHRAFPGCVILSKWLNFSVPLFSHVDNNKTDMIRFWRFP